MNDKAKDLLYRIFIDIPNLPISIIIAVYIFIMLVKESGIYEVLMMDSSSLEDNEDIINHLYEIIPDHLDYFVAFVFWASILYYIFY